MNNLLFYLIIAIVFSDFLFERISEYLNQGWRTKAIPVYLQGIYDKEKYQNQQAYSQVNGRFSLLSSSFSFLLLFVFLFLQGFAWLNDWLSAYITHPLALGLVFLGLLFLVSDLLGTPFDIYQTFVIEERFGFNKTTAGTYFTDKLKAYVLGAVLGFVLYALVFKLYQLFGKNFWLLAWGVMAFFMLFMSLFYSNLIVPLFNKQTPLPPGELRTAIEAYSQKVGFKLNNIYQINGSKRSTRANAYFTGFGPQKRIVLYDTLIEELKTEEIVAVLAHEVGHYKKKHTLSAMLLSLLQTGLMLYVLGLFIDSPLLSQALGVEEPAFHLSLIAFSLLYSPFSTFSGILMNIISRKNEFQADAYAKETYSGEHLVTALKALARSNLSNLTPHPFYAFLHYSHPPLGRRILALGVNTSAKKQL